MECADRRLARFACAAALVLASAGCATLPEAPPEPPAFPGVPADHDLRAEYRAAVCARVETAKVACERVLLRETGESGSAAPLPVPESLPDRYRIGLVPGLFAECLAPIAKAFGDVDSALRARRYDVTYFNVAGRGTAARNAQIMADRLAAGESDPRPLILVTYSKGLTDALEYLVSYPEAAGRVAAIISIAGAANGSPLADAYQSVYRDWLARVPMPGCQKSDGSEIQDLKPEVRREWWSRHGASVKVPIFSLVTTPRGERLSLGLRRAHASLSEIDSRNDGKVLWFDQLVPGNYLLGFLNADHWAVATPLDQSLPLLAFLFKDDLPRAALVEGAIEVAAAVLARDAAR